jgi:hypothetical protein
MITSGGSANESGSLVMTVALLSSWIRVSRGIKTDPKVFALSEKLGISHEAAIGLLVQLWLELPDHARDGAIANVPDQALEVWAGWRSQQGQFAAAFRELFQTTEGKVNAWDRHNGRALERAERERERVAAYREEQRTKRNLRGNETQEQNAVETADRTRTELGNGRNGRDGRTSKRSQNSAGGPGVPAGFASEEAPPAPELPSTVEAPTVQEFLERKARFVTGVRELVPLGGRS